VVPEKENGNTHADPAAGPAFVVQVVEEAAVVVLVDAVVVVDDVVEVVVVLVEVVVDPQVFVVQTGLLSLPQTHVLQSTV